jgi:hypothetical protein
MRKVIKKILKGVTRPDFEQVTKSAREHCASIMCNCGQLLHSNTDAYHHWQMGHFDIPVYDYIEVNEPDGFSYRSN